jgi:cytochrome P450
MATATNEILPPGPNIGFPRSLLKFRRDSLAFLMRLANQYGDVVYFKIGPQGVYLINNPEYIKDILVTNSRNFVKSRGLEVAKRFLGEGLLTSEGEFHRRQRRLAQPAFHQQRIASYGAVMVDYADRLSKRWNDNQTVDIAQEMMKLTLAVVSKTLFDADVESEAGDIREALTEIMHLFRSGLTLPFGDKIEKILIFPWVRFQRAKARLDATIYRIINERRASGIDRGDLLSMLLISQDEDATGGMTDQQVHDEAMTLFLAGHETTANALTWTWYLISQSPEVERRIQAELATVLGGRLPTAEDVARLEYTESVLAEAMRLYPPAWAIGRRALSDYQIGDYNIPAGSILLMSQWVTHHDERFFSDPFKFDPDRWTPQHRESRPRFSYYPFGGGPRVCIGEAFAWMEGVLLIATLAQQWEMKLVPGHRVKTEPLITLRPKYGMQMILTARGYSSAP